MFYLNISKAKKKTFVFQKPDYTPPEFSVSFSLFDEYKATLPEFGHKLIKKHFLLDEVFIKLSCTKKFIYFKINNNKTFIKWVYG